MTYIKCQHCDGFGQVKDNFEHSWEICEFCNGTGKILE